MNAWIGIIPKRNATGGKQRLGSISKAGNRYLHKLLVVGALSVVKHAKQLGYMRYHWLTKLMERRSVNVAAIALANSERASAFGPSECVNARTIWAMMAHNESCRAPQTVSVLATYRTRGKPCHQVGMNFDLITHPWQSAQRPGQPISCHGAFERMELTGTRFVESMMASGYATCRVKSRRPKVIHFFNQGLLEQRHR